MASLATIRELLSLAIARLEKADPHDTIDAIATQIHTAAHMCRQFARLEKVVEPGGHRVLVGHQNSPVNVPRQLQMREEAAVGRV
jgi:hypothetical protein